jgi:hypothetical protein
VENLDEGSIVNASLSIGKHPAIVLSTREEIDSSGLVFVVAISANDTISLPEDLIEVPKRLGMKKKCYVQCDFVEKVGVNNITPTTRRAWGPFLELVKTKVKAAKERKDRAEKSTPP